MNYGEIKYCDTANGPFVRISIFVSGCTIHCKNCFNSVTWDFNYGQEFDEAKQEEVLRKLQPSYIKGLTILGGEPFEPSNQAALLPFMKKFRELYPKKTLWCFSGYVLDKDIQPENGKVHTEYTDEILSLLDVLVDGPFVDEKKNFTLRYRGSENQRLIDMPKTLKEGKVVLLDESIFV